MSFIKNKLYKELELKNEVSIDGINADLSVFKNLDLGGKYQQQIHSLFEMDHETHANIDLPCGFISPNGLKYGFNWDRKSKYSIEYENEKYYLTEKGNELFQIEFHKKPKYYDLKTSDGTLMSHVATYSQGGAISVAYSNECSLKDRGLDCLFCNANATKDTYAEKENITFKNPKQIGETVAEAYKEGARHLTLTGGFIPERREVDYYIDVAEEIKQHTGLEDFNATAVIGAPLDLEVIDKYKEAGFRTIAMNLEIWDKNIYKTICPGKVEVCGGWEHWNKALEYAVKVFGYGRVRCGFVAGIEPKKSTLEGVETLAAKGIISLTGAWNPNPGSALEGHRTPEPAWHFDMALKSFDIFRKAGFTYENYYDIAPSPDFLIHDLYRIEDELLPIFKEANA